MERDSSNHPGPTSGRVNITGDDLSEEQLAALTPEQRTRLTSGEPVPVDPRSPLAAEPLAADAAPREVAEALDRVEGMGDGDGDGIMDHSASSGEDTRETETGATTDAHMASRRGDAPVDETDTDESGSEVSDTPLTAGLHEPDPWTDNTTSGR